MKRKTSQLKNAKKKITSLKQTGQAGMLMNLHSGLFFSLNLIPFLNGKYFRAVASLDPMSVDDNVQIASQLLNARCKALIHAFSLCKIRLDTVAVKASVYETFCHLLYFVGSAHDDNLAACLHQSLCHAVSKTSGSAGHNRFFPLKYNDSLDSEEDGPGKRKFNYIYIPEYQRDFTWDEDRQSKLIESIVLGLPIPFIFVAENKDSSWEIVDGSQRIRTIHSFLNGALTLRNLKSITSLNGYRFDELDETRKGKILNTALRIIVLSEETTNDVKTDMFERINRGSDLLKPMEKRKGSNPGKFTDFIYRFCKENKAYRQLVKLDKWLAKRSEYEELLLRFYALSDTQVYNKGINYGITSFIDEYLIRKNKEWGNLSEDALHTQIQDYTSRMNLVIRYVEANFPYGFRHSPNPQTKRSVFEAVSVGVWLALKNQKELPELNKEKVRSFISSSDFKQYTHVANELHKKQKLYGHIHAVYRLVTGQEVL